MQGIKQVTILLFFTLFMALNIYSFPTDTLFPEIDDSKGIVDYNPETNDITNSDIQETKGSRAGWTATSRGGILSAVGFFNYGDTVIVEDEKGNYIGKYIVFATSTYRDDDRETTYKLLKPIHKKFSSPRIVPSHMNVKKRFSFDIEPSYSALFSKEHGYIHKADVSLFMPKFFYPVQVTFGPMMCYRQSDGNAVVGGFVGGSYALPLDYMANTVTNLHFLFDFKCLLGTSVTNGDSFYYGYDFSIGIKWYPWRFMSVKAQFTLASLYSSNDFSRMFQGYGATFGVGFEI